MWFPERYGLLFWLLSSCLVLPTRAQQAVGDAAFVARIPFRQYTGGVMVVTAHLKGKDQSLQFILDTGSGGISLDSSTCVTLGLNPIPSDTMITGMGQSRKVRFVFDQTLRIQSLEIPKLNFHVNDYEILSSVYGEKIDGIIGYSFFSRYIAAVNFDSSFIDVYSPGKYRYPRGGHTLKPAFTTLPIVNLNLRDDRRLKQRFYFDTGAGLNLLLSEKYVADSSVLLHRRKPLLTQAEGIGGRLRMRVTVIKQLKLGPYRFRRVPTYVFDDTYNVTAYPQLGGVIGNDLLRRFNLVINYPKREIHLQPNLFFKEPFDYAYTGMALYFVDDHIMVDEIMPGSPAEVAGLQKGDILVSVGTLFTNNIMQYKTVLQTTGQKIPLIVRRADGLTKLSITPKRID